MVVAALKGGGVSAQAQVVEAAAAPTATCWGMLGDISSQGIGLLLYCCYETPLKEWCMLVGRCYVRRVCVIFAALGRTTCTSNASSSHSVLIGALNCAGYTVWPMRAQMR